MKAALFDLDGTLVESRPGIIASLHHTLRVLGHEPETAGDLSWAIGPPLETVMRQMLALFGDERVDAAVAEYRAHYSTSALLGTIVFPGIPAALDELANNGWRLFVATSKRVDSAREILSALGLAPRFASVHGAIGAGVQDQKPSLIARLLQTEGLDPNATVMVGDRHHDIEGARANAVRSIGALWGYGRRNELEAAGADALAATPQDLLPLAAELIGKR
jgi:phosphoglycolate phosphatase